MNVFPYFLRRLRSASFKARHVGRIRVHASSNRVQRRWLGGLLKSSFLIKATAVRSTHPVIDQLNSLTPHHCGGAVVGTDPCTGASLLADLVSAHARSAHGVGKQGLVCKHCVGV